MNKSWLSLMAYYCSMSNGWKKYQFKENNMSEQTDTKRFEPVIIGFTCNWCSYRAANMAGTADEIFTQYPPDPPDVLRATRSTACRSKHLQAERMV
jgi:hypothetical protein